ncbi:LPXTG cell wall anchor domain-containing protein, partial [Listeria newyorkensis]
TSVQSGVNEGTIEAAKQLVEALPEGTEKNKVSRNPEKLRFDHSSNISPHSTQKEQADKEKLPTTGDVALISSSILGGIMTLLSAIYMRRRK